MPRDVSLSDSKCWNGGHEWVNPFSHTKLSQWAISANFLSLAKGKSFLMGNLTKTGKTSPIRRVADCETGVSRHHWDHTEVPFETPRSIRALSY